MKNEMKRVIVEVPNDFAVKELVAILNGLKQLSDMGCSRGVKIEGDSRYYNWDGDGPSRIKSITIE